MVRRESTEQRSKSENRSEASWVPGRSLQSVTLQPQWGWNKKIKSQLQAEWRRRQD